jgi:SulP family sulfate permease
MFFASLRGYRVPWIPGDLIAGLLLAAIAIPEQIATARLAGMPPATGLYAFAAGTIAFVIFGRNRYLSVGADSTIATIFAVSLAAIVAPGSPEYALLLGLMALLVGGILVAVGIARAEWISDLLSIPVTVGFLAGIAVQIVVSQLPSLLGVSVSQTSALPRIAEIIRALPHTNLDTLALGALVLAIIFGCKIANRKLPGALFALAASATAVALLHLQDRVAVVGALHVGLPQLRLPFPHDVHAESILPVAAVVAVVCVLQTVTTLRTFRSHKGIVDVSSDVAATGIGSLLAGIVGAFPVDASPPRTAIVASAGARSQLAGIIALLGVALFALLGGGVAGFVPQAALAGTLIYIASEIFRVDEMRRIARESRLEIVLVVLSAVLVVALRINVGMMLSILLSLFYGVYVMLRPPSVELVHVPGTTIWWPPQEAEAGRRERGIVVFSPAAPLYFMNVRYVCQRLVAAVSSSCEAVTVVIVEGSGVSDIDYTGAHVFKSALRRLQERGMRVAFARFSDERAVAAARRAGIVALIGEDSIFKSVQEAVEALVA